LAKGDHHDASNVVEHQKWVNYTLTHLIRNGRVSYFHLPLQAVPNGAQYDLQMHVVFAGMSELYTVQFDRLPVVPGAPSVIHKEKCTEDTVVLQTVARGAQPGWKADALRCGVLAGQIESDVPVVSVSASLHYVGDARAPPKDCPSFTGTTMIHVTHPAVVFVIRVVVQTVVFLSICCCVLASCRLCCRRCNRRACVKACKKPAADATTPYPAEMAQEYLVPVENLSTGSQYFVPIPVDPTAPAGTQYVQLMPIMYPTQQV